MNGAVFVITPTYKTPPDWLKQCVRSVEEQSIGDVQHILINDACPSFAPPHSFKGDLINLPRHYGDNGDTPRWIGVQHAIQRGADVIAFLDADNWFERSHLEICITAAEREAAVVSASKRWFVTLEGSRIAECDFCGTDGFADTSAMVFFAPAFEALKAWGELEEWQHPIGDRLLWDRVKRLQLPYALTETPTLSYRCTHRMFYERFGLPVPSGVKTKMDIETALERWER